VTTAPTAHRSPLARPLDFLGRHARGFTIANVIAQGGIIATGGLVRLTDSGLGCSTWPECEPGEFTPVFHEATSYHPFVEFGNRTVTVVLLVIAIATALAVWRTRRDMRWWGLVPVIGVLLQAVLGGIVVHADLNPWLVAPHLWLSAGLVWVSVYIALRYRTAPRRVGSPLRPWRAINAVAFVGVLFLGALTTGAGPHSGDAEATERLALDPAHIAKLHALSVWVFIATLAYLIWRLRGDVSEGGRDEVRRAWVVLLIATLLQGVIGYVQYFTGLPILAVELHLIGIAVLTAAHSAFFWLTRADKITAS
jgi:cytochrome c oxidase assembly protein subunit 15